MANIKYRESSSAANKPGSTTVKGTPLTNLEMDGNFKEISDQIDLLVTNASPVNDATTNAWVFPIWATSNSGQQQYKVTSAKLKYNPSTDTLVATRFQGTADFVTTNANLTGMVTSVGNATTVVTNANLNGMVTSVGNTTTVVTNANLNGMVTSVGNTTTVVTNAAMTGEATSSGSSNDVILTNSAVISKVLTGFTSGTGTVTASDSILTAIQKLAANDGVNAALTGEATSNGINNAVTLTNSAVIGKVLTGYTKGAGTVVATDNILQAIQKLDANADLKAPLASPTFTGTPAVPLAAVDTNTAQIASTQFYINQASAVAPSTAAATAAVGTSTRFARADHVHKDVRPAFRAYRNSTQSLTSGANAQVQFATKSFDTGSTLYDTANYKWTPGIAGYYQLNSYVRITATAINAYVMNITVNDVAVSTVSATGLNLTDLTINIGDILQLSATDFVKVVINVTGTSPVIASGSDRTVFSGSLVSIGS